MKGKTETCFSRLFQVALKTKRRMRRMQKQSKISINERTKKNQFQVNLKLWGSWRLKRHKPNFTDGMKLYLDFVSKPLKMMNEQKLSWWVNYIDALPFLRSITKLKEKATDLRRLEVELWDRNPFQIECV